MPSRLQNKFQYTISLFDDRIEIWGCGPLPEPLTIEDLKIDHISVRRNPWIAECFFIIGSIERWGKELKE